MLDCWGRRGVERRLRRELHQPHVPLLPRAQVEVTINLLFSTLSPLINVLPQELRPPAGVLGVGPETPVEPRRNSADEYSKVVLRSYTCSPSSSSAPHAPRARCSSSGEVTPRRVSRRPTTRKPLSTQRRTERLAARTRSSTFTARPRLSTGYVVLLDFLVTFADPRRRRMCATTSQSRARTVESWTMLTAG